MFDSRERIRGEETKLIKQQEDITMNFNLNPQNINKSPQKY